MQVSELIELLAYLHDADFLQFRYDPSATEKRAVWDVKCHPDCGFDPWNGRTLQITASDVWLLRWTAHGHFVGSDSINMWDQGVSAESLRTLNEERRAGLDPPALMFSIVFHSGSVCEFVCRHLKVDDITSAHRDSSGP